MNDRLSPVLQKVEFLLYERNAIASHGLLFHIVHRFREPGADCLPGEEIYTTTLQYRAHQEALPLTTAESIVFDYLAKHRRVAQTAAQIEAGIKADPFYAKHGGNAKTGRRLTRRITRRAVKEYVKRIRQALGWVFQKTGLIIDPKDIIVSEKTAGNEVRYRLHANVVWHHWDLPGQ